MKMENLQNEFHAILSDKPDNAAPVSDWLSGNARVDEIERCLNWIDKQFHSLIYSDRGLSESDKQELSVLVDSIQKKLDIL